MMASLLEDQGRSKEINCLADFATTLIMASITASSRLKEYICLFLVASAFEEVWLCYICSPVARAKSAVLSSCECDPAAFLSVPLPQATSVLEGLSGVGQVRMMYSGVWTPKSTETLICVY